MFDSPRVAVVIPCFNQAHYLPDAVGSVCNQTFEPLEVVVVDDGSPDDTSAVAAQLARQHPERTIRVIRQANQGLPASRNRGIESTEAEYILTLDADDMIAPDFLERCVTALDEHPEASIAFGGQQQFGDDTTFHAHAPYDFVSLTHMNQIGVASVFRRRAWVDAGGFSEHLCSRSGGAFALQYEDWDFWVGCGESGHFGIHVPEAVFLYRVRSGSMFTQVNDQGSKAHVVLNHPVLYTPEQTAWAEGVVAGDPSALAIHGPRYAIPIFGWVRVRNVRADGSLPEARQFATLARAEHLLDNPCLLTAYADTFSGDDDASLVVCGSEDQFTGLGNRLMELGLDGPDSFDILGIQVDDPQDAFLRAAGMVDALLTREAVRLHVPLPRVDESRVGELQTRAQQLAATRAQRI